jgi:hypothetical protein
MSETDALGFRYLFNKFGTEPDPRHLSDQHLEWGYAFDVHCNAFFSMFLGALFGG